MAQIDSNPSEFLFIFNNQVFSISDVSDNYLSVFVKNIYGNITFYEGKYYPIAGVCKIDLFGVLKNLIIPNNDIDYSQFINEGSTMIPFTIEIVGDNDGQCYNAVHYCIFGVTQIFEKGIEYYVKAKDLVPEKENKWLTGFTRPKCWKGFPFSLSFVYGLETDNWLNVFLNGSNILNLEGLLSKQLFHVVINTINLPFINNINTFEDEETQIQLTETLYFNCINTDGCTPVYLRWLNQLGGYDYFMFYKKDVKEQNKTAYVNKYPDNLQAISGRYNPGTMKAFQKQTSEVWVIGADNITINELNELRKISRSMKIDLYIPDTQCWLGINVADNTLSIPLDEELSSIELNLLMPEILTQC